MEKLLDEVLSTWGDREWSVQGFGMLRTYLDDEFFNRFQIWDQRLAVWGNGAIHDHPWDFTSTILCGNLWNQRYKMVSPLGQLGVPCKAVKIIPGTDGGAQGDPISVFLAPKPLEMYTRGESYGQRWNELHRTRYEQGTVTVITRRRGQHEDVAWSWSMWEDNGIPWVFFRPRPASENEILSAYRLVRERWVDA